MRNRVIGSHQLAITGHYTQVPSATPMMSVMGIFQQLQALALKIPADERYRDLATVDHESSGAGGAGSRATRWILP
jgi:hypothetical protein